jgi:hypothetical protein
MPAVPDYEWIRAPSTHRHVSKTYEACNYLQALEGGLDTSHSSFLHNNKLGDNNALRQRDRAPHIDVFKTEYGYQYVSTRKAGADGQYIRVYQYFMPTQALRGGVAHASQRNEPPKIDGHIWVPIDDEHTHVYNLMYGYDSSVAISPEYAEKFESFSGRGKDDLIPGTFRLKLNPSNKYMIDRQVQKTKTYTGIKGLNTQDFALQKAWARSSIDLRNISAPPTRRLSRCVSSCSKRPTMWRRAGLRAAPMRPRVIPSVPSTGSCRRARNGARRCPANSRRNGRRRIGS